MSQYYINTMEEININDKVVESCEVGSFRSAGIIGISNLAFYNLE